VVERRAAPKPGGPVYLLEKPWTRIYLVEPDALETVCVVTTLFVPPLPGQVLSEKGSPIVWCGVHQFYSSNSQLGLVGLAATGAFLWCKVALAVFELVASRPARRHARWLPPQFHRRPGKSSP
jgi:hypothetical protein